MYIYMFNVCDGLEVRKVMKDGVGIVHVYANTLETAVDMLAFLEFAHMIDACCTHDISFTCWPCFAPVTTK